MGRKGKTQNHTAKELAGKAAAAKYAAGGAGGGGSGAAKRKDAGAKAAVLCEICKGMQPNMKSMTLHYESKHPKANWAEAGPKYEAMFGGVRQGLKAASATYVEKKDPKAAAAAKKAREEAKLAREKAKLQASKASLAALGGGAAKELTPAQAAVAKIKQGDAATEEGKLAEALVLYKAALAQFGGKRPKLEQKIKETQAKLQAEAEA